MRISADRYYLVAAWDLHLQGSKRAPSMLERARGDSQSHVTDVDPGGPVHLIQIVELKNTSALTSMAGKHSSTQANLRSQPPSVRAEAGTRSKVDGYRTLPEALWSSRSGPLSGDGPYTADK